ncbi:hypothetical protein CEXT_679371 [Caerostris extrusa]|uniref:Uncharacterized protein n=1 Tax=Caerostris extrusa TaxID=172846 RepID=A0AAV4SSV2_CAEEX|nr:hypothetical protein CEXT_679371 [Caerostris extrusa]
MIQKEVDFFCFCCVPACPLKEGSRGKTVPSWTLRPALPLERKVPWEGGLFHRGRESIRIPPFGNCNNDQAVIIPTQNPLFQLNWEENEGKMLLICVYLTVPPKQCPLPPAKEGWKGCTGRRNIPPFGNCNNDQAVIIPTQNPLFQLNWEENGGEDAIDFVCLTVPLPPAKEGGKGAQERWRGLQKCHLHEITCTHCMLH